MTTPVSSTPKGLRRYGALSRLSSEIASSSNERDLVDRVTTGLEALFEPARRVAFFRADPVRGDLIASTDSSSGRELLASLHALLPEAKRGKPALVYMAAPNLFFGPEGAAM